MGSLPGPPNADLPAGAWDSHVHVVDQDNFPLHPDHPYTPKKATLDDLLAFEESIGCAHVCLVAFSVYQTDNRSLIDALVRLKGKARGIACIDPDVITDRELQEMHNVGVRGVRMNLRTTSRAIDREAFVQEMRKHADKIRPLGWVLQLYVSLNQIELIAPAIPSLGVTVIFDHMGSPEGEGVPRQLPGYAQLMQLLKDKKAYVKLSGIYRFPGTLGVEEYVEEVLRAAPTQVVWASDWPHSGGPSHNPGGNRMKVQDYRKVSIPDFITDCMTWLGHDEALMRKIWVENPRRLWQYDEMD